MIQSAGETNETEPSAKLQENVNYIRNHTIFYENRFCSFSRIYHLYAFHRNVYSDYCQIGQSFPWQTIINGI